MIDVYEMKANWLINKAGEEEVHNFLRRRLAIDGNYRAGGVPVDWSRDEESSNIWLSGYIINMRNLEKNMATI